MRHIYRLRHKLLGLLVGAFAMAATLDASAQCNPTYTGTPCVGSILNFKANAPGYTSWLWEFGSLNTSTQRDPGYAFPAPGTYTVKLTASSPTLGNCVKTFDVTVLPSPKVDLRLNTPKEQCFNGNFFCFRDSSTAAPGSSIVRATYLFEDGDLYETTNPSFPRDFCKDNLIGSNGKSIIDARGGWFNLLVELEDANGCVTKVTLDSVVRVFPKLGIILDANGKVGCDSTEGKITNVTYLNWLQDSTRNIGLKDVASFTFDFGDGTIINGDSVTNTEYWTGPALDAIIIKKYKQTGTFDATLTVRSVHGCVESFTYRAAATNYSYKPVIVADPDSSCTSNPEVQFKAIANGQVGIPGARFLWNFGNPPTGPLNFNNNSWTPSHQNYGAGPWMISLNIKVGPCDVWIYDTILKVGPSSAIEVPFVRVAEHEKFQCQIKDSVHFTNSSTFYHDDPIWQDEDSIVWFYTRYDTINGVPVPIDSFYHFVFNFDPNTHSGPQTIVANANQIRHKDHVLRIWTLGDNYAPGCTTDSKINKNVDLNCNYTLDSLPVHWYTPWDEIYYTNNRGRFYKNPFPRTLFSRNSRSCFVVQVYADSIVYIPARLTMGYPGSMQNEVKSDSFLLTMFQKYKTDLFTLPYGSAPDTLLYVEPYDTVYIYVPSGSKVVNRDGATGDIFDINSVPTTGVNDATGPGYFRIVGKSFGSPIKLESGTGFDVMHTDAEIIYDSLRECYNGPIIYTMTKHDQDFNLEAGVTVEVKDLNSGLVKIHTGPKILTVEKDQQFTITTTDSLCPVFWSETERADRVVAQTSFFQKDTIINGRDSFINVNAFFIDSAYHRDYFYKEIAQCNSVTLWHKDTVHPFYCESTSNISLALIPPYARGLKWESGTPCVVVPGAPFNPNYYLTFAMDQTKPGCTQKWFEVNYDTLACDTCWVVWNSGGVLAPPAPGSPLPFVLPYQLVGAPGTKFIKAYTPNQVQIPGVKRLDGSFGIGLVIGNGPPRFNSAGQQIAPECTDTAFYADMFRIKYMDPSFDIVMPTQRDLKNMCVGDTAYLRVLNPVQEEIKQFAIFWNTDDGTTKDLALKQGAWLETYNYFEEYDGPVTGRNDQNVTWDPSKKWLYTYVEQDNYTYRKRAGVNQIEPFIDRDTLVTRIYRKWEVRANTRNADKAVEDAFKQLGLDIRDIDPADVPLYLGDGTIGCIDTTGISDLFEFYIAPIEKNVVTHGKYKYLYTDYNKTDSTIIEEVFHYRDSSLRGSDTAIAPYAFTTYTPKDTLSFKKGDKIPDLYTLNFKYPILIPDPCDPNAPATFAWEDIRGVVHTYVAVENLDGCQSSNSRDIIVGFFNQNRLAEEAVCKGTPHRLLDSIRYFTNDDISYPLTYPILPIAYWEDPARYAIRELKYVDWDADDGKIDYETSIQFSHVYDFPGTYTINYAMRDSNNCTDTIQLTAYVTGIKANFETNLQQLACKNIITFFDSSIVFDPCRGRDTCPDPSYEPCDSVVAYEWDFGDGSRTTFIPSPSHDYTSSGWFTVKLKVWSALGCVDSVEKQIFIPGPQPEFTINNTPWGPDSIIICVGESVELTNLSGDPKFNPNWLMYWGDGSTDGYNDVNDPLIHVYDSVGVFYLSMLMNDTVPGIPQRCYKLFPDTSNLDGKVPRQIKVIVMPITPASFVPQDTVVCPNEPIIFTNTSDQIYTRLLWSFGDGDTITRIIATDGDTIIHSYPNPGTYKVTLEPDYDLPPGDFGPKCLDIDSGTVVVTEVIADFEIDSTQSPMFCFKDSSLNATKWSWTFQDQDGDHFSSDQNPCYDWGERIGSYIVCLAVENADGCTDTICKPLKNIFRTVIVPYNVFTPNVEDALNQKFVIDVESHEEYEIKIYNRWGEKVFESTDPANPWDGTIMNNGKECPAGTYFYIINYKLRSREYNDGLGPIEGMVTLIR